jgi:bla regulator protein BlaR1
MSTLSHILLVNAGLATVFAVLVAAACRSRLFQYRPALIHILWLLVLGKLIAPPLIPVSVFTDWSATAVEHDEPLPIEQRVARPPSLARNATNVENRFMSSPPDRTNEAIAPSARHVPWGGLLFASSGCVSSILIARSYAQLRRLSRVLHRAATADERFTRLAQGAAARMGLPRAPVICTVDASMIPFLWVQSKGPVIVLPTRLVGHMSDEQITCILCHELAHYARRDHWSNLFAAMVTSLFWWHPVAWWARRGMRAAQEVCCDGLALAAAGANRRCYADTLFQALDFVQSRQSWHRTLVTGFGDTSSLKRRFEMIANGKVNPRVTWYGLSFATACIAVMLCVPVRGQSVVGQADTDEQTISILNDNSPGGGVVTPDEQGFPTNPQPGTQTEEENAPAKLKAEIERLRAELWRIRRDLAKAHYANAIHQAQAELDKAKLEKPLAQRDGNIPIWSRSTGKRIRNTSPTFSPDGPYRQSSEDSSPN